MGQHAIDEELKVAWFTLVQLAGIIRWHRVDDSVGNAVNRALRADRMVIDDIGLLPVPPDPAEA